MTEDLTVETIDFSGDDEKNVKISVPEFIKDAQIEFEYDWGNGHAIIISFETTLTDDEQKRIAETIRKALMK